MRIACVHVPRFAIEVERRRRRELSTRLILIGDATVSDYSLGAAASGVKGGMRMSEAIGLCPQSVALPPDLPYYRRRFEEVLDILGGYSPKVEPDGLDTAFLSLEGLTEEPQAYAEELIAELHRRLGFMASVGIAGGKFAGRVAATTTRPGLAKMVPPDEVAAFLAPLPVDLLPAGESMGWRLRLLGIETIGDIASLPLGAFQSQFGPEGKRCWELANGIDREPLAPRVKEEAVVRRLELPAPAVSLETILAGVERLVHAAYGDSGRGGRWVRKVVVRGSLDGPDGQGGGAWELAVGFREALADPGDAWFAVKCAIERRPPERPVEELEVELVGLSGESGKQAGMFDGKAKLEEQVEEAVRQLRAQQTDARSGRIPLGKVVEVEPWSRIPERRMAIVDFGP